MRQQGQVEAGGGGLQSRPETPMHLAVVACGERLEETLTMIKSAVLFSIKRLYLHIFAEDQLHAGFMEAVSWKYLENSSLETDPKIFCRWLWMTLSLCVDHILYYISLRATYCVICVPVGVLAWFYSLQIQLHSVLHQLPQWERSRVEETLQTLRLSEALLTCEFLTEKTFHHSFKRQI